MQIWNLPPAYIASAFTALAFKLHLSRFDLCITVVFTYPVSILSNDSIVDIFFFFAVHFYLLLYVSTLWNSKNK